ncbi:MAG: Coenzyme F420 hydrogenase/dehydrogenase, beta subunit C-terminal domain [Bacilli bacterium]|nr:Coenzyme F420 hydrogenase/dehydrogenase, beta subunit C-terminal domain [Bacilli bacterium]
MSNILEAANKCTGCGLCSFVCPKHCIQLNERASDHFKYPEINSDECINCGLCLKSCPTLKEFKIGKSDAYCYQMQPINDLLKSSSGGTFQAIAKYFLLNNGVVYGAAWDNLKVHHIRIDNVVNLDKVLKSKYIQSEINTRVYEEIKADVENGTNVLFSGTPCQCAAVANMFAKRPSNLFLIDIICRGISNQWAFDQSIKAVESFLDCKIKDFDFRHNQGANKNNKLFKFEFEKRSKTKVCYGEYDYFPYYKMFQSGKGYRESCYNCQFRSKNRASDITLGDFWGFKKDSFHKSLIIANTSKGSEILQNVFNHLDLVDYDSTTKLNKGYYGNPSSRSLAEIKRFGEISIIQNELESYKKQKEKIKVKNLFKRLLNVFKHNKYEIGFTYKIKKIK